MIVKRAYKFRLIPTGNQRLLMAKAAGCARLIYNKSLELEKQALAEKIGRNFYEGLCKKITAWKKEKELSEKRCALI